MLLNTLTRLPAQRTCNGPAVFDQAMAIYDAAAADDDDDDNDDGDDDISRKVDDFIFDDRYSTFVATNCSYCSSVYTILVSVA